MPCIKEVSSMTASDARSREAAIKDLMFARKDEK
jgi:hypothetical protein